MRTRRLIAWAGVALLTLAGAVTAAPEDTDKAETAVKKQLQKYKAPPGQVKQIKGEAVASAFPKHHFFSALYRLYPVAVAVPKPLKHSNVFAVSPDGKVTLLTDAKGLAKYVKDAGFTAANEEKMKDFARAWLRLSQQFQQDGFYTFETLNDSIKVMDQKEGKVVRARLVVMKGGNGDIKLTLDFFPNGQLEAWEEKVKIRPGPRPRCQATLLLDDNPLVRQIAEADLLIMGRAAKSYLDEQRAKASPELRRAIDRVWQRIVAEGR